ncbi:neurotrimin-like [Oratosquilla oratoria]|uniref:neurotrimin-like n=1 Tax=Oratosquilla oratoria TaxID=337810 RepID=UPI003F76CB6E
MSNEILPGAGLKEGPTFGEPIMNLTVTVGREATLSCVVDNLANFKVGWLKVESQTILSLQKRVVTHNTRVSVTHDEHRTWNLHIKQVKESDRGCYMCQINTPNMKNQVGCIEVLVPPDILNDETSSDTTVSEGDDVTLRCQATGHPTPNITWKREDGKPIVSKLAPREFIQHDEIQGSNLTLHQVTRRQMGAYLCMASNKVPPIVSKRIILNVNFSPLVSVENQLIGAPLNTMVVIDCEIEAYPAAVNYWEKNTMILETKKHQLEMQRDSYRVTMRLIINNFTRADSGQYKCISSNSLGRSDTTVRVYVIEMPTSKPTTEVLNVYQPTTTYVVNSLDQRRGDKQGPNSRMGVNNDIDYTGMGGSSGGYKGGDPGIISGDVGRRQRLEVGDGGLGNLDNNNHGGPFRSNLLPGSENASSSLSPRWRWLLLLLSTACFFLRQCTQGSP